MNETDSSAVHPADLHAPPQLPPTPRPITATARRRSWHEGPVRVLVILTLVTAAIATYLTTMRVRQALQDRRLIENGLTVDALIVMTNGTTVPKRWPRNETIPALLRFKTSDGIEHDIDARLEPKPDAFARVGDTLRIKVDPADPQVWTEQTQPRPWSIELVTPAMLVSVTIVLVLLTLLRRRQVLSVWRDAPLVRGVVVEQKHTATAPASRSVRFSLADTEDRRIRNMLVPTAAAQELKAGDSIWVVCEPRRPGIALLPSLYAG